MACLWALGLMGPDLRLSRRWEWPAGAVAAAGLARDAEAESSQRLGGGRVTRGRVGGVVADQQAARARPDGARQVVPDQVRPARAGHAVEQDVHVVEAHRAGRLPVHGIAGPDAAGPPG